MRTTIWTLMLAAMLAVPLAASQFATVIAPAADAVSAVEDAALETADDLGALAAAEEALAAAGLDGTVAALTGCRDLLKVTSVYWQGQVTDRQDQQGALLADVRARVTWVLTQEPAADAARTVQGFLTQLPGGAEATEQVTRTTVPADVHLSWTEEYVEWERLEDVLHIELPLGVVPALEAGVEVVRTCEPTPRMAWQQDARYEASARHAYNEGADGWYVDAASIDVWVDPLVHGGGPASELPLDKGWGVYPDALMRRAVAAVDGYLLELFAELASTTSEAAEEAERPTSGIRVESAPRAPSAPLVEEDDPPAVRPSTEAAVVTWRMPSFGAWAVLAVAMAVLLLYLPLRRP